MSLQLEHHVIQCLGWLRAAVLGANDGVLSTSGLIIGVASAQGTRQAILAAGLSGLVAGAMSMAAGEYVSVSSQADSGQADLTRESLELKNDRPSFLGTGRRDKFDAATLTSAHSPPVRALSPIPYAIDRIEIYLAPPRDHPGLLTAPAPL